MQLASVVVGGLVVVDRFLFGLMLQLVVVVGARYSSQEANTSRVHMCRGWAASAASSSSLRGETCSRQPEPPHQWWSRRVQKDESENN